MIAYTTRRLFPGLRCGACVLLAVSQCMCSTGAPLQTGIDIETPPLTADDATEVGDKTALVETTKVVETEAFFDGVDPDATAVLADTVEDEARAELSDAVHTEALVDTVEADATWELVGAVEDADTGELVEAVEAADTGELVEAVDADEVEAPVDDVVGADEIVLLVDTGEAADVMEIDDALVFDDTTEAGDGSISFESVLHQAMASNPAIDMADARIDQAFEQSRQSGSYRFPTVAFTATVGPEFNDPAPNTESGHDTTTGRNLKLSITQALYDGGSSRAEYKRSQQLEGTAAAEARIEMEDLFLDVANNYIDYWRYQYEMTEAEQFVDTMNELVGNLEAMYRGGAASKLEVDFAKARLASSEAAKSAAMASLNNSLSELEYLVPGLKKFVATSPEEFISMELSSLDNYLEQGASLNSGFVSNHFNREATRLRVRAQKGSYLPTVDFEMSASVVDDEGGSTVQTDKIAAKLLLNYTLYNGGQRKGAVRRAEAQLRELEAERVQMERDVFRAIDQSYNSVTSSRLTLDAVKAEIAANEDLQKLNRKNLELGMINIIELIDVEERLYNALARKGDVMGSIYQEYLSLMIAAGLTQELLEQYSLQLPEDRHTQ